MIQVSPASFVLIYLPNLSITPRSIGLTVLKPENNIIATPTIAKIIPSQLSPIINKIIEELNVYVLDSRGNTFIISKKKISQN